MSAPRTAAGGFTLVELLVAMLIGLLVLAGALSFTEQGRGALREREQRAQLLEQARAALAFMETDLQMAGYWGLTNRGGDLRFMAGGDLAAALPAAALSQDAPALAALPAAAHACGANFAVDANVPLQASDGAFAVGTAPASACEPRGGSVPGSDTLVIRRALAPAVAPDAGRLQLLVDRVDAARRALFVDGVLPAGTVLQPGLLEVHDVLTRIFYVSNDSDGAPGLPALRVKTLGSVAGTPTFVDTEVMPGIADLQVQWLRAGGWVAANRPAAAADVRAARLTLVARAQDAQSASVARLSWSRTVLLRDASVP